MLPFLTAQANNLVDLACLIFLGYICLFARMFPDL